MAYALTFGMHRASASHRGCPAQLKRPQRSFAQGHANVGVRASTEEISQEELRPISEQLMQQMKQSITESLEAEKVEVVDVYGDGRHVNIEVVSKLFEGETSVKRQRLVYKVRLDTSMDVQDDCIGSTLTNGPHAVGHLARTAAHSTCCRFHEN